jgi:hypothetical protein
MPSRRSARARGVKRIATLTPPDSAAKGASVKQIGGNIFDDQIAEEIKDQD